MYEVIKNKGKWVKAYQLGSDNAVIKELMLNGKICNLGDGRYEIHSQEAVNGAVGGEKATSGPSSNVMAILFSSSFFFTSLMLSIVFFVFCHIPAMQTAAIRMISAVSLHCFPNSFTLCPPHSSLL